MKKFFCLLLICLSHFSYGQDNAETTNNIVKNGNNTKPDFVLNVNDTAADFTVQMINGETVKMSDLKGKVVLLNFWATWCVPCLMEFRELPSKIIEPFKNSEFVLLPISSGETIEAVKNTMEKLKEEGIDFNVGFAPDKSIYHLYGNNSIPKNFIIDHNGIIRYVFDGYATNGVDTMASEIQKLLDEQVSLKNVEQKAFEVQSNNGDKIILDEPTSIKNIIIFSVFGLLAIGIFVILYRLITKRKKQ